MLLTDNLLPVTGVELICQSMHLWWEGTWDLGLSGTGDGRAQEAGRAGVVVDLEIVGDEKEGLREGLGDKLHGCL